MTKLMPVLGGSAKSWTADASLPGGDIPDADFTRFQSEVERRFPWLPQPLARRLARAYGTRIDRLVGSAGSLAELGEDFGDGIYEAEIRYLMSDEFACTVEDMLWRRSKLGLHIRAETKARLTAWLSATSTRHIA
jgi:glycerol-3-phosphate dehydrogenase